MTFRLGQQFGAVLAAAQTGSEQAVAQLYGGLQPALLRYLQSRAGQAGEDIAGQVWLEVARGLRAFNGDEDGFRSWVFSLGHRRLTDHLRACSRRPAAIGHGPSLVDLPGGQDPAEEVLEAMAGAQAAARVAQLLPPELAEVVLLRVLGGLSAEEVATVVGRPAGTVRVQQHRGLRRLAQRLSRGEL